MMYAEYKMQEVCKDKVKPQNPTHFGPGNVTGKRNESEDKPA